MKVVGDIRLASGFSTARLYVRNGPVRATTFSTYYRPHTGKSQLDSPKSAVFLCFDPHGVDSEVDDILV